MTAQALTLIAMDASCQPGTIDTLEPQAALAVTTLLKAVADPLRLRMLAAIANDPRGESCVCDLTALGEVSQPTVSHHLKVLRDAGLLASERRGTWVWYRIAPGHHAAVTALLTGFVPAVTDAASPHPTAHNTTEHA